MVSQNKPYKYVAKKNKILAKNLFFSNLFLFVLYAFLGISIDATLYKKKINTKISVATVAVSEWFSNNKFYLSLN